MYAHFSDTKKTSLLTLILKLNCAMFLLTLRTTFFINSINFILCQTFLCCLTGYKSSPNIKLSFPFWRSTASLNFSIKFVRRILDRNFFLSFRRSATSSTRKQTDCIIIICFQAEEVIILRKLPRNVFGLEKDWIIYLFKTFQINCKYFN